MSITRFTIALRLRDTRDDTLSSKKILALPGDGIGPEIISNAVSVIEASSEEIEISYGDIGMSAYSSTDQYLPSDTISMAMDVNSILAGKVQANSTDPAYRDPLRALKKHLGMYSVVRKFYPLCDRMCNGNIDMILLSGNHDMLLNVIEKENLDGITSEKYLSTASCIKLFTKAKEIATMKNRSEILCAHRSDMLPMSDKMFVDYFYKEMAATEFSISDDEVGNIAENLILNPSIFDIIVCTDIYSSTIAGTAAGLVGGSYLTPVGNMGDKVGLFEPMTSQNIHLNPTSAILAGAMAVDYVGLHTEGENIRNAVRQVYNKGNVTTDVGGTCSAAEFTENIIAALKDMR